MLLYGDSGTGKSSLVNAGLIPEAARNGFCADRIRVQPPPASEELVIERIQADVNGRSVLPSTFAVEDDSSERLLLSTEAFRSRLYDQRPTAAGPRPLLIFDQFEELITLFEEAPNSMALRSAEEAQERIVDLIVELLQHETLAVKVLLSFREDYLAKVKELFVSCPELVDQSLRLTPPRTDALVEIIRGPFEQHPGQFESELSPELAERLSEQITQRSGSGEIKLTEVQIACLRLWNSPDPDALLNKREIEGLLVDDLQESLGRFSDEDRYLAITLLSQMVTAQGTRNVISAENLLERVRGQDDVSAEALETVLDKLEGEAKLVRREWRDGLSLYEIRSEYLLPWISEQRQARLRDRAVVEERDRQRKKRTKLAALSVVSLALMAAFAVAGFLVWQKEQDARHQKSRAEHSARVANSEILASESRLHAKNPALSLLLALAANRIDENTQARSAMTLALERSRGFGFEATVPSGPVRSIASPPDKNASTLAIVGPRGTVQLWDLATRRPLGPPMRGGSIAFSPNEEAPALAIGGLHGTVQLLDLATRRPLGPPLTRHSGPVLSVAFSRDGQTLASGGSDGTVQLWDATGLKPKPLRTPLKTGSSVKSLAFSRDGHTLATGGQDGSLTLWDVASGTRVGRPYQPFYRAGGGVGGIPTFPSVDSVTFSPDGRTLAAVSHDGTLDLFRFAQRKLGEKPNFITKVTSVAFSPDERTLATGGHDGTLRLWDVASVEQLEQLGDPLPVRPSKRHLPPVQSVAFGPDGLTLATGDDAALHLWAGVLWSSFRNLYKQVCTIVPGKDLRKLVEQTQPPLPRNLPYAVSCRG